MITRSEIARFVNDSNLKTDVECVWAVNCTMVPELLADSKTGEEHRFALAEHIIATYFESETANQLPGGAFSALCQWFRASEQDIAIASEQTRQDFASAADTDETDMTEADVATTLIWLWFIEATDEYGEYTEELKFFLYSVAYLIKDDQKMKRGGKEYFASQVKSQPTLLFDLLGHLLDGCPGA